MDKSKLYAIANELDELRIGGWVDLLGTMVFRSSEHIYVIDDNAPNDRLTFIEAVDFFRDMA